MKRIILVLALATSLGFAAKVDKIELRESTPLVNILAKPIEILSPINFVGRIHMTMVKEDILAMSSMHPALASSISMFIGFAPFMFAFSAFTLFRKRDRV